MVTRRELALLRAMYQHETVTAAAASINMTRPRRQRALLQRPGNAWASPFSAARNRRLQLTSQGRALLPEVLNALAGIESVDRLVRDIRHRSASAPGDRRRGDLRVQPCSPALARLRRMHPDVAVTVRSGTALEIIDMAVDHRIDLGIIIGAPQDRRVETRTLSTLSLFCILRRGPSPAARKRLT